MSQHISKERKTAYYVGLGLQILGGLLFASTFVSFLMRFGDFTDFESRVKSEAFRAFGGMALLIIGGVIRGIGAKGLAGSGVLFDPEAARDDLEPYSRMVGGMVKDAMNEAKIDHGREPTKVIMIKCSSCGELNQELAKYCQECGTKF